MFGFGSKNTAEATIKVNADTKLAKKALKDVDSSVKGMNKSFRDAKNSMGLAAAAIVGVTIAAMAAKKALDFVIESNVKFEAAGAKLKAILKPTSEEFKLLEERAIELGKATVFTASQVTSSFIEMGKLGLKTNEILAAGNDVLALAAISQVEMAEAATITVQTLNQFQLEATAAGRVVDVIADSFVKSALDITKFSEAMKYIGPIAGQTGEKLEDITGALAVLADNALDSSLAGTGMRRMLIELADENSKASKKIRETGIEASNFVDKLKILKDMQLSITDVTELFGIRAVTAAKIVIENANAVEELSAQFDNANGAAKEMAKTMLDSVEGSSIRLKSAQESLALSIRENLLPVLREWNELWIKVINSLTMGTAEAAIKKIDDAENKLHESTMQILLAEERIKKLKRGDVSPQQLERSEKLLKIEEEGLKVLKQKREEINKIESGEKDPEPGKIVDLRPKGTPVLSEEEIKEYKKQIKERYDAGKDAIDEFRKYQEEDAKTTFERDKRLKREQLELEQTLAEELINAKEESYNEMLELDEYIAAQEDERERQRNENRIDAEKQSNIELLGINRALYEERIKDLETMLKRELITEEDYLKLRAIANKEFNDNLLQERIRNATESFNALSTINNAIMAIGDARTQREIKNLEDMNLSEEEFEKRKEEILKESEEKSRAFARVQQGIIIAQATMNAIAGGVDIFKNEAGGIFTKTASMIAGIAVAMAEVMTIQAQHFQVGRIGQNKRGRQVDNISALLGQGETVVPAPQSAAHEDTLRAIVNNTANTAAGVRSMGRGDTIQIYGASNEQILNVINAQKRKRSVGLRI